MLEVVLTGDERSDSLVFVVKEGTTWYDKRGDNFEVGPRAHRAPTLPDLAYVLAEGNGRVGSRRSPNKPGHMAQSQV